MSHRHLATHYGPLLSLKSLLLKHAEKPLKTGITQLLHVPEAETQKSQPIRAGFFGNSGGQSRNRTKDTRIFKTALHGIGLINARLTLAIPPTTGTPHCHAEICSFFLLCNGFAAQTL
jgi:hypothetical protein